MKTSPSDRRNARMSSDIDGKRATRGSEKRSRRPSTSTDTAVATDDEGYGLTYLFGDGWVKYADTKQSIALVEWPRD